MSLSLRIGFLWATSWLSIMLVGNWCGEVVAFTVSCQANAQEVGDGVQEAQEDRKPSVIRLPRANLAAISADLTAPIGIAPQDRPILDKLETRRLSLDVREVRLADVIDNLRDQVGCNILLDQSSLEEEGVTPDTPLTAHLIDAPFGAGNIHQAGIHLVA